MYRCLAVLLAAGSVVSALPSFLQEAVQATPRQVAGLIVDLDYAQYQGSHNAKFDTNVFLEFDTPLLQKDGSSLRAPSRIELPSFRPPASHLDAHNPMLRLSSVDFNSRILGNEDCLFLNVFAPANATKLPVLVWIHGGGYGAGSASSFDFSYMDQTVNNGFISVAIQYRLGAFGFLSSAALVEHGGLPNAALHDMRFALQWVEKYISRFGGDPDQVTIGGESAGGGSVMLLAMANGGEEKTSLFRRAISSSPYLPTQPNFDDPLPTEYYQEFARRAGCLSPDSDSAFKCLQNADTLVLQNASAYTSYGAKYGQWSFIPVTDGKLIRKRPTEQLREGKVNGEAILTGNNANEGNNFVPQNITTESHFISFLKLNYPLLSPANLAAVMKLYSIDTDTTAPSTRFDTDGLHPPYATSMSAFASGWQQAANNLYAETTFVCSANWLADAFTVTGNTLKYGDPLRPNRTAWRYQFSIPNAFHGQDVAPLLADPTVPDARIQSEEFRRGFQSIWGRFIVAGDPTLPGELTGASDSGDGGFGTGTGAGGGSGSTGNLGLAAAGSESWHPWGSNWFDGSWWNARGWHEMLNINVTEGTTPQGVNWAVVDGNEWEGWRRERCGLWAELGEVIRQ